MFNASDASRALFEMLRDASSLGDIPNKAHGEFVNDDPNSTPWLGVYRGGLTLTPWTMGRGANNLRAVAEFKVIVQEAGVDAPEDIMARLDESVASVLGVIWGDTTLKATVGTVTAIRVEHSYYASEKAGGAMTQFIMAMITITTEGRTS